MTISLHTLPQELQTKIFKSSVFNDLVSLSRVSKKIQSLVFSSLLSELRIRHTLDDAHITYITFLKGYGSYFYDRVDKVAQLIHDLPELRSNVFEAKQAIDGILAANLKHSLTLPQFMLIGLLKNRYHEDIAVDFLYSTHCSDFINDLKQRERVKDMLQEIRYLLEAAGRGDMLSTLSYHVLRLLIEHKEITLELADFLCDKLGIIPQDIIDTAIQHRISEEIIKRLKIR